MKVHCTVNTYGERETAGHMPLKDDLQIELSNDYNGFTKMKVGNEVFYVYTAELEAAMKCMCFQYKYRCQ